MGAPRRLVAATVTVAALLPIGAHVLAAPAGAQTSDKARQLQEQLHENEAETAAARQQLADAQAARQKLNGQLAGVSAQIAATEARLAAAQAEVERAGLVVVVLGAKAAEIRTKLDAAKLDVKHSALMLYTRGSGSTTSIALLGAVDGSGDLVEGKHYLQRVNDKRQADVNRVSRLQAELDRQQAAAAAQKEQADAARAAAADEKARLDELAARQQAARDAAAGAEARVNGAVGTLRAKQDQLEAELQAESDRVAQLLGGDGGAPMGNGTFIRPVGGPVTSSYGRRTDPVTGATAFHAGIDFGSPCGTPIKAAGTGVVVTAGPNGGYGNMTLLNHGGGMATLYAHQSSIIVSAGQAVNQGQVIGYVGSTGKSTGCHLHFEVRQNGNPVNPAAYL